ncbi:hypothetical protein BABINDRAFT_160971 [Babjeviella inositovora NRRL Y-12698]|uniref:Vacuolar transporter chaperone complex subunit 4 n=1 Tax=Babjeviella inositovora NRRL Y-12698 TaxID=984486 RepID=A0A1E3QUX7_9ASCO|nr:uncharacterized protein BABINDRAFT_160971 [Babjeviella inositovora NRRL Y-12698]ODQ80757.1 hypothetical protein BABINDRAFT_160971 [Babjeviella inositovora NRRL Y-12698]
MKFGETLKSSLIQDYNFYYINYEDLKYAIKKGLATNQDRWSNTLEEEFLTTLENELDKIHSFTKLKLTEINRRIKDSERLVYEVVSALNTPNPPLEEEFQDLEEELSDIIADVHDLAKFTRLNYTGFQKIIKKHDKLTGFHLRPIFQVRLEAKPFFKDDYDPLVVKISKLYDLVRTRGNPVQGDSSAGGSQQNFVRQTTKYWVHPDNITELKLIVLKHLPVLVFNANKEFEKEDSAITSIYYDNKAMDLYYGRLRKDEGAEAIRLRWYGSMKSDTIFVERKTHREDWTGEKSVKARFSLKEKKVNDFMSGKFTVPQAFEKMRKEGKKSSQEVASLEALAEEVQYRVLKDRMRPVCRSFYNRTAFQLPGDARVRISLDTELTMVREDNFDGHDRTNSNWRRMDIGVDYPFDQLPPKDVCRFPYAVLEVKLQTQMGQEPPQWVRDLVSSHLVEAIPKFSKFIHGCATLLPDYVDLIPFWLPQMDIDIRKPKANLEYGITRANINNASLGDDDSHEGGYMDEEELMGTSNNAPFARVAATATTPLLLGTNRNLASQSSSVWHQCIEFMRETFMGDRSEFNKVADGTVFSQEFHAPPGKEICVPVRVEPKVYFATERTFLSWLSISLILSATSLTLLNYGTNSALTASIMFYLTTVMCVVYATGVYLFRIVNIRKKRAIDYEDKYGPKAICGLIALSCLFSFAFKAMEK